MSVSARPVDALHARLRDRLRGRVCIVGVGNRDRGDDGIGPFVVDQVAGRLDVPCIDAGPVPENVLEPIVRSNPETVLMIDAADLGAEPGGIDVLERSQLGGGAISCHAPSLRLACDYLHARTGAQVVLLAVQPSAIRMGSFISLPAAAAAETIVSALCRLYPQRERPAGPHAPA